jgi:hypothetical protein
MKTKQSLVCGLLAMLFALTFGTYSATAQEQELRVTGGGFTFTAINGGTAYSISGGASREGTVNIPAYRRPNAESDYLPIREIGRNAFNGGRNIIKINIPSTVTSIDSMAFAACLNISSITIPASVTYVSEWAFYMWTNAQTIYVEGHANRESTIAAGWGEGWSGGAKVVYQGK